MAAYPLAVIELIKSTDIPLHGSLESGGGWRERNCHGKPIALLLTEQMATVTLCHIATRELAAHAPRAEFLVVAVEQAAIS